MPSPRLPGFLRSVLKRARERCERGPLPEHLHSRIPQALLDLEHDTLVHRLCTAALEVIDSL